MAPMIGAMAPGLAGGFGLFRAGKKLYKGMQPPELIPPPGKTDEDIREAARLEALSLKRRKGFASTILTGPMGVTTPATTKKETLG